MKRHRGYLALLGMAAGFLNGLFGSGGGTIAVPLLHHIEPDAKKCHATSIAIILPLSMVSLLCTVGRVDWNWQLAWQCVPSGLVGALLGAFLLRKIPNGWLRRIFGGLILISAVRLWLR